MESSRENFHGPVAPESSGATPAEWSDYSTVFTNDKAGMQEVDKDHVKKVVYDMSKVGSHFLVFIAQCCTCL